MTANTSRRVLVTGAEGFVGGHLVAELTATGNYELYGTVRLPERRSRTAIPQSRTFDCNILDPSAIAAVMGRVEPTAVIHLAGRADVGASWKDPVGTMRANVVGTLNVIQAVLEGVPESRLVVVSTAGVYGHAVDPERPLTENSPVSPLDPYSVSKAAAELLAHQYFVSHGLQAIVVRPFNHIGPGQSHRFLVGRLARRIAEIEAGTERPVLTLGNLSSRRDFTDVRDVARAYRLLMERGVAGKVYNVSTRRAVEIRQVVDIALAQSRVPIKLELDVERERPMDLQVLLGDSSKLRALTDWEPTVSIEQSIGDAIEHARSALNSRG